MNSLVIKNNFRETGVEALMKNLRICLSHSKMYFGIKKLVFWKVVYLPTLNQFAGRLIFVDILSTYFEEIFKMLL